jgi:chromosome segregation ATPase
MGLFGNPPDDNRLNTLEAGLEDLRRQLEAAVDRAERTDRRCGELQRDLEAVDLHARAIVEECKRLINKFERRLDRETPESTQDAPGPKIAKNGTRGPLPIARPPSSRNY